MVVAEPVRVTHTYRQQLQAAPAAVFPLLCPVRETDWVSGWAPSAVYSYTGGAEEECVFTVPEAGREAVWVITEYDPAAYRLGFVKVTPGRVVVRIRIELEPDGEGCAAAVCYSYTALSTEGEAAVRSMTREAYEAFMRTWEDELNAYLTTRRRPGA